MQDATDKIDEATLRKLLLLRVQLYTAVQTLKGEALAEFWALIAEIEVLRQDAAEKELTR